MRYIFTKNKKLEAIRVIGDNGKKYVVALNSKDLTETSYEKSLSIFTEYIINKIANFFKVRRNDTKHKKGKRN